MDVKCWCPVEGKLCAHHVGNAVHSFLLLGGSGAPRAHQHVIQSERGRRNEPGISCTEKLLSAGVLPVCAVICRTPSYNLIMRLAHKSLIDNVSS